MDYLQYNKTWAFSKRTWRNYWVLNLVINGLPSILETREVVEEPRVESFKPCYKWITFNTLPN